MYTPWITPPVIPTPPSQCKCCGGSGVQYRSLDGLRVNCPQCNGAGNINTPMPPNPCVWPVNPKCRVSDYVPFGTTGVMVDASNGMASSTQSAILEFLSGNSPEFEPSVAHTQ